MFASLNCGFDIVSGGELERVRRAAPEALPRVVFSGVGKQAWEIDAALRANDPELAFTLSWVREARRKALSRQRPFVVSTVTCWGGS